MRPFDLRDALAIRQLQPRGVAFDLRRLLLHSFSPARAALLGHLTRQRLGTFTLVQTDSAGGRTIGYIQAWPRVHPQEWDLAYIAPSLDHQRDASDLWHELLSSLILVGGQRNILRIYARVPEDMEIETILRQCGFTVVTREQVFVLVRPSAPAPLPRGMRPVERQDRWALEQLYRQVVPPLLHQAEDTTLHDIVRRDWWRHDQAEEYIWIDRERALAHFALVSAPQGYWLQTVVRPESRGDLLPCIRFLLTRMQCSDATPVYAPVPDFTIGLGWLLRTCGFESYNRQTLMVAHTVVHSTVRRALLIPGLDGGMDARTPVGHASPFSRAQKRLQLAFSRDEFRQKRG